MDELADLVHCPSCSQQMEPLDLPRRAIGRLRVDLCFGCCLIWFDQGESAQLAPAAVIELFQRIGTRRDTGRSRVAASMSCPRCTRQLTLTHDMCKSGPLQYFRCTEDSGRLTPFFQFLREKQFLRTLTPHELARARIEVKQLQCSNCGAPIDLEHTTSCSYCGSPVSILDIGAVQEALQMWTAEDTRGREAQAQATASALRIYGPESIEPIHSALSGLALDPIAATQTGGDLLQTCIASLTDLLDPESV